MKETTSTNTYIHEQGSASMLQQAEQVTYTSEQVAALMQAIGGSVPTPAPAAPEQPVAETLPPPISATPVNRMTVAPATVTVDKVNDPIGFTFGELSVVPAAKPVAEPVAAPKPDPVATPDETPAATTGIMDADQVTAWLGIASTVMTAGSSGRKRKVPDADADMMLRAYATSRSQRSNIRWRPFTASEAINDMPRMNRLTIRKAIDRALADGWLVPQNRYAKRNIRYRLAGA
jgi:hypothetical protein